MLCQPSKSFGVSGRLFCAEPPMANSKISAGTKMRTETANLVFMMAGIYQNARPVSIRPSRTVLAYECANRYADNNYSVACITTVVHCLQANQRSLANLRYLPSFSGCKKSFPFWRKIEEQSPHPGEICLVKGWAPNEHYNRTYFPAQTARTYFSAIFRGVPGRIVSSSVHAINTWARVVPRAFLDRLCRCQFLFRFVRIHSCLYVPGPVGKPGEVLAYAIRPDLSRLHFFAAADGAVVFLRCHEIEIPSFCLGHRTFEVRDNSGCRTASGLGAGQRAGVEFGLLESFRRIIFLFAVSVVVVRVRPALARTFASLRSNLLADWHGRAVHLSLAEAGWSSEHKSRNH